MTEHSGNVQPQLDLEEHAHISGVPGKKVFNVDSSGNVLNFETIGISNPTSSTVASVEDRKQTPTGSALNVQIGPGDVISFIPVVIDFDHHQIHEGETHRAQSLATIIGTNTVQYGLVVPTYSNTVQSPHLIIGLDIYNGSAEGHLYEGATFTGGVTLSSYNRNRNSLTKPGLAIKSNISTANGTLIDSFYSGAGSKAAEANRAMVEWVLKSNTNYRFDIIGKSVNTEYITDFNWYEDLGV